MTDDLPDRARVLADMRQVLTYAFSPFTIDTVKRAIVLIEAQAAALAALSDDNK